MTKYKFCTLLLFFLYLVFDVSSQGPLSDNNTVKQIFFDIDSVKYCEVITDGINKKVTYYGLDGFPIINHIPIYVLDTCEVNQLRRAIFKNFDWQNDFECQGHVTIFFTLWPNGELTNVRLTHGCRGPFAKNVIQSVYTLNSKNILKFLIRDSVRIFMFPIVFYPPRYY